MALIRRTESSPALAPNRVWDPFQMMDALLRWDPVADFSASAYAFAPAFEVRETRDAYVFSADLPGLSEEQLELTVNGSTLTIAGQRQEEQREDGERVHMYERRYGAFSRSFALPEGVDTDRIDANLSNGVLKVEVPKKPEHKPRRISLRNLFRSDNEPEKAA
jgi:HSP20 family protein